MLRPKPTDVKPLKNYLLSILFDNGEKKIFDVKPLINGCWFEELNNPAIFNTVKIAGSTVEWINGQDVCPDDLYYLSTPCPIESAQLEGTCDEQFTPAPDTP